MTIKKRMTLLFIVDSLIVLFSIYLGYFILHPDTNILTSKTVLMSAITIQVAHHILAWYYGLYRKAWSYASIGELKSIFKAVTLTILVVAIVQSIVVQHVYVRALFLTWMLHILLIGGSRMSWRITRDTILRRTGKGATRTMIVGAGAAGTMVARQLLGNHESTMKPVLFVDDDETKSGLEIFGIKVFGGMKNIPDLVKDNDIEKIVIAIPSLDKQEMASLTEICLETGVRTQTIPRIEDLMTGKVSVNDMQDVRIEDLLGRDEVQLDLKAIADKLTNKTILVTGAGGSIGSEICRQVSEFRPKRLILLGHGESSIYSIDMELRQKVARDIEILPIIADIKDRNRIFDIVSAEKPDVIYHAAAHKHVPLMEANPMEAVKNNIFGTKNVAEAADMFGVPYFVLVSTDKAVNPPNVMGATKRFAEMIVQNLAKESTTKFAAVRFGNVLGSRGSVVPLFKEQIAKGGPVTVTDPEMTRYFMTIPEASRLVIQAGTLAAGGEVFVLDMGEPVRIVDLAKNLIKLSGYDVDEIGIRYSGIRPGEKLFEELLNEDEIQSEDVFPKIHIGKAAPISETEMEYVIERLPEMSSVEVKETLVGLANRKVIEGQKKVTAI
ncbi:nucleoside-diphosphate sugar epimerase/dehydratase [Sporosarcina pasteurii]|uniref:UDP-glucose 4-epimerase n=1 Tax=Sporosarcina pasteurii TaxID=1474 RepID=A0A380BCW1_SPOPA|nr:nucleoside-diphosphate sugar epimerase/dehydratase [Sporosarcina pasteurii]MDS9472218.1 nucleoside-diphosphate sugar epimerase/dehydratase [Sporosarcina pasteurii]QBQ06203.1 polysaccharide biosynthesis protein [Sporosarcina pasteurii]SUI99185.1 UDP-glucose 4-epimerase [Sporosarcina pasteurii]